MNQYQRNDILQEIKYLSYEVVFIFSFEIFLFILFIYTCAWKVINISKSEMDDPILN